MRSVSQLASRSTRGVLHGIRAAAPAALVCASIASAGTYNGYLPDLPVTEGSARRGGVGGWGGVGPAATRPNPMSDCPVDLRFGHKSEEATDIHVVLSGEDFVMSRAYTSKPQLGVWYRVLGEGWMTPSLPRLYWTWLYEPSGTSAPLEYVADARRRQRFSWNLVSVSNALTKWTTGQSDPAHIVPRQVVHHVYSADPPTSETLPVWSLVEPGIRTTHFGRHRMSFDPSGTSEVDDLRGFPILIEDVSGNAQLYEYLEESPGVYVALADGPRVSRIWCLTASGMVEARIDFTWSGYDGLAYPSELGPGKLRTVSVHRPTAPTSVTGIASATMARTDLVRYRYFGDFFGSGADNEIGGQQDLVQVERYELVDAREGGAPDESVPAPSAAGVAGMNARVQITQYRYWGGEETCPECEAIDADKGDDVSGVAHQLRAIIQPEQIEFYAQRVNATNGSLPSPRPTLLQLANELIVRSGTPVTAATTLWTEGGHTYTITDLCSKLIGYESASTGRVTSEWSQGSGCGCGGAGAGIGQRFDHQFIAHSSGSYKSSAVITECVRTGEDTFTPYRVRRSDLIESSGLPTPYLANDVLFEVVPGETPTYLGPWVTHFAYDGTSAGIREFTPAAKSSYSPSNPYATTTPAYQNNTSSGLVYAYDYGADFRRTEVRLRSGTPSQAGDLGLGGSLSDYAIVERTIYGSGTGDERYHLPKEIQRFRDTGVTATSTSLDTYVTNNPTLVERQWFTYGFHGGSGDDMAWRRVESEKDRLDENGPFDGSSSEALSSNHYRSVELFDPSGRLVWEIAPDGAVTRREYNQVTGQLTVLSRNAAWTGNTADFASVSLGTPLDRNGDGGALRTDFVHDLLGRVIRTTSPSGAFDYTLRTMRTFAERPHMSYYCEVSLPRLIDSSTFAGPAELAYRSAGELSVGAERFAVTALSPNSSPGGSTPSVASYTLGTQLGKRATIHALSGAVLARRDWHHVADSSGYHESRQRSDPAGRLRLEVNPNGTVTRHTYDAMDREIKREVGTIGSADPDDLLDSGTGNLLTVGEWYFDHTLSGSTPLQGYGNGHLTWARAPADGANRDTKVTYDFRGRAVKTVNPLAPHEYAAYDNLDRMVARSVFSAEPSSLFEPWADLVRHGETAYSQRGLSFRDEQSTIIPSVISEEPEFVLKGTRTWYDENGRPIESWRQGTAATKFVYDGLGRQKQVFITDRREDEFTGHATNHADAASLEDDRVLEQTETRYITDASETHPAGAGLVDLVTTRVRTHDSTFPASSASGDLSGAGAAAITTYRGYIYDVADRLVKTVEFGCNLTDGTFKTGGSIPSLTGSLTGALVAETSYNTRGLVDIETDPDGTKTRRFYDDLDRVVGVVENYVDGAVQRDSGQVWKWALSLGSGQASTAEDRATITTYNGAGDVEHYVAAYNTTGTSVAYQRTLYIYGAATSAATFPGIGSATLTNDLNSNDLLVNVIYPDASTPSSGECTDCVRHRYNRQGESVAMKDQNGTVHAYTRDALGRIAEDFASALGSDIDGTVRSIKLEYDGAGRPALVQSRNAATGTPTILNAVRFEYADNWTISKITQNPLGAVVDTSVPAWQSDVEPYSADDGRMFSLKYPSNPSGGTRTEVTYDYGSAGDLAYIIGRPDSIGWNTPSGSPKAELAYLGSSSVVRTRFTKPLVELNRWVDPDTGVGTAGTYKGLDRFARIRRQLWIPINNDDRAWTPLDPTAADGAYAPAHFDMGYTYSSASDVTGRNDLRANGRVYRPDRDEAYTYDGLHRLTQADRGKRVGTTFTGGSSDRSQKWTLDGVGNWLTTVTDLDKDGTYETTGSPIPDIVDTRTFTATGANEILTRSVHDPAEGSPPSATVDPTYDAAGNMTVRPVYFLDLGEDSSAIETADHTLVYDAWNRLVKVRVGSETHPVATYSYNGLNQRVARLASPVPTTATITQANLYYYDAMWRLLEERIDDGYTVSGTPSPFPLAPTGASMSVDRIVQRIWGLEYIDQFLCMQTDVGSGAAPDGDFTNATPYYALTDRLYNVVGMLSATGVLEERVRYTAYGVARRVDAATALSRGDWNGDGVTDALDLYAYLAFTASGGGTLASTSSAYDPDMDFNADEYVNDTDLNILLSHYGSTHATYADGDISTQTIDNTVGFAGYMFDPATGFYLARHRWHDPAMGRWVTRDPLGTSAGANHYLALEAAPGRELDPSGLKCGPWTPSGPVDVDQQNFRASVKVPNPNFRDTVLDRLFKHPHVWREREFEWQVELEIIIRIDFVLIGRRIDGEWDSTEGTLTSFTAKWWYVPDQALAEGLKPGRGLVGAKCRALVQLSQPCARRCAECRGAPKAIHPYDQGWIPFGGVWHVRNESTTATELHRVAGVLRPNGNGPFGVYCDTSVSEAELRSDVDDICQNLN